MPLYICFNSFAVQVHVPVRISNIPKCYTTVDSNFIILDVYVVDALN